MDARKSVELMAEALENLVNALELLDKADAPGDIGAYVDHARERLSRTLQMMSLSDSITTRARADPAA